MNKLYFIALLSLLPLVSFAQENSIDLDQSLGDYIDCGNNASVDISGNTLTIEAWVYPNGFQAAVWQGCVIAKDGPGDNGYLLRVGNGGQVNFNIGSNPGSWNEITSVATIANNTWSHIAGTYDGTTMRLYINGVEVASGALSNNVGSTTNSLMIGEDPWWSGREFPGRIDEVMIWNTARSATQINADMNSGHCTPLPSGLVAYYRFNQGVATANNAGLTTVIDETGTNNGTLINSSLNGANSNWHFGIPAFPAPSAAFTLTEVCAGANATLLGNADGVFSFNPAPGDGAVVNAASGTITNGVAGTTYFVEYTVCGISTIESVTVLTDDCWTLNGNATNITVGTENCIQLTAEVNNQLGCAWSGSQIDFASDFNLTLDYYFGNNINGADGNTFTFQPSASTACGTAGGQMGAGGLSNALAIEFDTYDNDNPMHVYDMACDHIAIEIDGDHQNAAPAAGPVCAKTSMGNIDDGNVYEVVIDWNAATQTLEVFFDGVSRLTYNNDIVNNVFGGQSQVYWGATAATGGFNNQQYFCPSSIVILPVGLTSFTSECNEFDEVFTWKTSTEQNASHFVLEYTYDGFVFYPEATVQAAGNSTTEQTYQARVSTKDQNTRYYRLKAVDMNGSFEVSDLISGKGCMNASLLQSVYQEGSVVHVKSNQPATAQLINNMGQILHEQSIENYGSFETSHLASGMYQVLLTGEDGTKEIESILVH